MIHQTAKRVTRLVWTAEVQAFGTAPCALPRRSWLRMAAA